MVYQPLPSASPAGTITLDQVTDKENPEVMKLPTLTLLRWGPSEIVFDIGAELFLMNESKAHLGCSCYPSGQQDKRDSVWLHQTSSYRAADGSLTWSYDVNTPDKTASGMCLSEFNRRPHGPADQARTPPALSANNHSEREPCF